jgi:hypothetical protein
MHERPTSKAVIQICSDHGQQGLDKANSGKRNFLLGECLTIIDIQLRILPQSTSYAGGIASKTSRFLLQHRHIATFQTFLFNIFFIKLDKPQ